MTIEEKLKDYIKSKYGNIRAFTLATGVPYPNIDSLLRRGIGGVTWNTVLMVCNALNIDVDALADGEIIFKKQDRVESTDLAELLPALKDNPELLNRYQLDGTPLTLAEEKSIIAALDVAVGIIRSGRCL